jgi:hypothetical protein
MAISVVVRRPPLLTRILATAQSGTIPRDLLEEIRQVLNLVTEGEFFRMRQAGAKGGVPEPPESNSKEPEERGLFPGHQRRYTLGR